MKNRIIAMAVGIVLLVCISCTKPTSPPGNNLLVYWEKTYGGNEWDEVKSVIEIAGGGFVLAGFTYSFGEGESDIFLIKTNSFGDSLWAKTYGDTGSDFAESVDETQDGGYIIAGGTSQSGLHETDIYLVRTDSEGNALWEKQYSAATRDVATSVKQTADGGFIATGGKGSRIYLIKMDQNGDTLWTKVYGRSGGGIGCSIQQTIDGGFIIAGYTWHNVGVYLLKTDANGDSLWAKRYSPENYASYGMDVKETPDGGFIIAGFTISIDFGDPDIYLIKTNENGDIEWEQKFEVEGNDYGNAVDLVPGGGYIIAGWSYSYENGSGGTCLIETDEDGNVKWAGTHGYENSECAYSILVASDGCYVVAGSSGLWDAYLIKIRSFSWYP